MKERDLSEYDKRPVGGHLTASQKDCMTEDIKASQMTTRGQSDFKFIGMSEASKRKTTN